MQVLVAKSPGAIGYSPVELIDDHVTVLSPLSRASAPCSFV